MIPKTLTIQGFRSFKKKSVIHIDKQGFYLLTGKNEAEPDLGANGAGKSTVWDALCWVLYGKTSRGLKGPGIRNWEKVDLTEVKLILTEGDELHTVVRTQTPNTLLLNGKKVEQKSIDDFIGINYSSFLSCVLMGQFSKFFFDLSPTEKLQVFTDSLELTLWVKASDKARALHKQADQELRKLEAEKAAVEKEVEILSEQLEQLESDVPSTDEDDLFKLSLEIYRYAYEQIEVKGAERKLIAQLDAIEDSKIALTHYLVILDKRARAIASDIGEIKGGLSAKSMLLDKKVDKKNNVNSMLFKDCPTCGRKITHKEVKALHDGYMKEIKELKKEEDSLVAELREAEKKQKENSDKSEKVNKDLNSVEKQLSDNQKEQTKLRIAINTLQKNQAEWQRELDAAEVEVKRHLKQIEKAKEALSKARNASKDIQSEYVEVLKKVESYAFWKAKFKDIRLWIVESALRELEVATNNCLVELGMKDWKIYFEAEKETQSGNVSRGFTVSILNPEVNESDSVSWEAYSGGETQRLRIAGSIGLAHLIRSRKGITFPLEIWDEPTAHLSGEGIDDLLHFLSTRAKDNNFSTWIVDHRSLTYGGFSGVYSVNKSKEGSRILKK